jgi:hypothetical protein
MEKSNPDIRDTSTYTYGYAFRMLVMKNIYLWLTLCISGMYIVSMNPKYVDILSMYIPTMYIVWVVASLCMAYTMYDAHISVYIQRYVWIYRVVGVVCTIGIFVYMYREYIEYIAQNIH